jgi:hypothetical protein
MKMRSYLNLLKLALLAGALLIVGCGGGGGGGVSYPYTKSMTLRFENHTDDTLSLWLAPGQPTEANRLAPGEVRTETITRTWNSEGEVMMFEFRSEQIPPYLREGMVTLNVSGRDAAAVNFGGFVVVWEEEVIDGFVQGKLRASTTN